MSSSHKIKSQSKRPLSDSLIYALVFNLIKDYEVEAEKLPDEAAKDFFSNYFVREAELSEEQGQILRTLAANFTSVTNLFSYKENLKLSLQYRDELRRLFGESEFRRFDSYIRQRVVPKARIIGSAKIAAARVIGFSSISVDESQHKLFGSAGTYAFDFAAPQIENCSVSATMSGPNVSVSGSDSDPTCADHNPRVNLVSSSYLPNSQYCVSGSHMRGSVSETTSDCLTTAAVSKVINIAFEQISSDDLPIDVNPNTGGGLRLFPDKKNPTDQTNRRKIRVRAKTGANTAGVKIYFRNFDPDDPSANNTPIDVEPSLNAGNDNNGDVDGTAGTRDGQFSLPQPNPKDCQLTSYGIACFTNSYGEAAADFTVTMQPGDNFIVAAGTDQTYLTNLALAADGINLKDTANAQIPATTNSNISACSNSAANACRTDLLTVWRRLHIEVDSM